MVPHQVRFSTGHDAGILGTNKGGSTMRIRIVVVTVVFAGLALAACSNAQPLTTPDTSPSTTATVTAVTPTTNVVVTPSTSAPTTSDQAAADASEAARVATEQEVARVAAESSAAERSAADQSAADQSAADQAEADRIAAEEQSSAEETIPPIATDHDAEIARVQGLLGLDRQPTSGEMQLVHGCEEGYIPTSTCAEVGLSGGKPEPEQTQLSQGPDCPYLNKGVCWDTQEEARAAGE